MKINDNEIEKIAEFASYCIEQDIRERHGLLLQWALIPPATREGILKKWKDIITSVIEVERRKSPTEISDNAVEIPQTPPTRHESA